MLSVSTPFLPEHEQFRETVRAFLRKHLTPHVGRWIEAGSPDRDYWRAAGEAGILAPAVPEAYGGAGGDFLHSIVVCQELGACVGGASAGVGMQTDNLSYHILRFGTEQQKRQWLPRIVSGETVMAICMTEPSGGSDVRAMRTHARRDGDDYVLNGAKTYITSGAVADLAIVAAKTGTSDDTGGMTLFLVDTRTPGFRRGKRLEKMGMHASDTLEIFLDDVRVPADQRLGEEGMGFAMLMEELPRERLIIASRALTEARRAFDLAVRFTKEREVFGRKVFDFQNTKFVLADIKAELMVATAYLNECLLEARDGPIDNTRAALAKLWISEMQGRVVDKCLQLHGGAGYMGEYEISHLYTSARVTRIFGGSSEVMRMSIARTL